MHTLAMATHVKLQPVQARPCSSDHALCPLALGQGSSLPWSTCAQRNRDSRWPSNRRGVFFSLHVKPPLWGCGTPSLGGKRRSARRVNRLLLESGKNVTFFEQLFCFYQLVLAVWNTFGAKFKLSFISWVKQNWHFCGNGGKNCPSPILGGLLGETGVREKSFLRSRVQSACTSRLFLLDHRIRTTCTVFLVVAMFAMTTMADSCTCWPPYRRLQALRPVEHIFHCLSNVWFFRQAHKCPPKLDDQFLEILTCWTRWQASFFIILKEKTSKPAQMSSSLRKNLWSGKILAKINHSGRKVTPEEWSCKVWSRFD